MCKPYRKKMTTKEIGKTQEPGYINKQSNRVKSREDKGDEREKRRLKTECRISVSFGY